MNQKGWRPAKSKKKSESEDYGMKRDLLSREIRVQSVIQTTLRIRGTKVEYRYTFHGCVMGDGGMESVPIRIVRDNWGKKLCHATPGSLLKVEGYWHVYGSLTEFHVVRGTITNDATYVDGYKPHEHPDGSWRWFSTLPADEVYAVHN